MMTGDTVETPSTNTSSLTGYQLAEFRWILLGGLVLIGLTILAESKLLPQPLDPLLVLLRLPVALVYVLFMPGYCLTVGLFPRQGDISGSERLALSLGLSAAWVPFLAYFLDKLPWGLHLWPIALGQLFVIVMFAGFGTWRRARV
ncbi:MAG: DUF1616 domain-containing protein, partial [Chloroflexota bacterium]